jgi:hypothetical protein
MPDAHPELPGDDSRGFAEVERAHVRTKYLPDFEWTAFDTPSPRRAPLAPLAQARVGLVDTCGAHLPDQPPVGTSGRAALVPVDADVVLTHPGYDTERAMRDPEVVHPAHTMQRLAEQGVIGTVAPQTVSVMGGVLIARRLVDRGLPATVAAMLDMQVDLALLVPA